VGGKVSKAKKKEKKKEKKKPGGGEGENKVPKKKTEIRGKKHWEGGGEKIKLQKKLRPGLRKDKQKKSTWDDTGIEKRILSVHHPSTLVHWWVLVYSGQKKVHWASTGHETQFSSKFGAKLSLPCLLFS